MPIAIGTIFICSFFANNVHERLVTDRYSLSTDRCVSTSVKTDGAVATTTVAHTNSVRTSFGQYSFLAGSAS